MERGDWDEAETLMSRAVKTCSDDPDAHQHYAEVLWHKNLRQEAVNEMREAARLCGESADLHVRLAEMQLELGQTHLAEQSIQHALDLDPKLARAWLIRGRVMHDRGQPQRALADYHRALGLASADPSIQLRISEVYRELGQPQRALAALDGALEAFPPGEEPQRMLYLRGLACTALGRFDAAIESYSTACIRDQPTAEILYRLAEAETLAGRTTRAADAAQQALALDPQHDLSRQLLGQLGVARGYGGTTQR
jgi:tetratricopeptide (TPR) repeat protein